MSSVSVERPLRVQLLFHNGLEVIQVIPMVQPLDLPADALPRGVLHGEQDLLVFIRGIPLDSIVQTQQICESPYPVFHCIFHVRSAESIVTSIQSRISARYEAYERLFDDEPLSASENAALAPFEHAVLGASGLPTPEGARRVWERLGKRLRPTT